MMPSQKPINKTPYVLGYIIYAIFLIEVSFLYYLQNDWLVFGVYIFMAGACAGLAFAIAMD